MTEAGQIELKPSVPPPILDTPAKVEITDPTHLPEAELPISKVSFGQIEIENVSRPDLLQPQEREIFSKGFEKFKLLVQHTDNPAERTVLANPAVMSGLVGIQPLVSCWTGEAMTIMHAFSRAKTNFDETYSFLEMGSKGNSYMLVNEPAVENVLRSHQDQLGITLPDRQLTKEERLKTILDLVNNPVKERSHFALGLLSGFPIEDCQRWVEQSGLNPISTLKHVPNPEIRFTQERGLRTLGRKVKLDPLSVLTPREVVPRDYLPDKTASLRESNGVAVVEGYGLGWVTFLPISVQTVEHCQKLMQVDKELGIIEFVEKERAGINAEDNKKLLKTSNKLLDFLSK